MAVGRRLANDTGRGAEPCERSDGMRRTVSASAEFAIWFVGEGPMVSGPGIGSEVVTWPGRRIWCASRKQKFAQNKSRRSCKRKGVTSVITQKRKGMLAERGDLNAYQEDFSGSPVEDT